MDNKNLLPVGFYDLIFDEAQKHYQISHNIISYLFKQNYQLIKPSLFEFSSSLKANDKENSFTTLDSISGKNISIRSDITLQIRRIVATRLKNQEFPLKLCYIGDILKVKSENLHGKRQQTQIGFEIIGSKNSDSEFSIIKNLIEILNMIKIKEFYFNFTWPNFLDLILKEINANNNASLKKAILQKNISKIIELSPKYSNILQKIARYNKLSDIALDIKNNFKSREVVNQLTKIKKLSDFFIKNYPQIQISFNLFGNNDSSYHQDIYFEIYRNNLSLPIVKGGQYKIIKHQQSIQAIGATIYANNI